MAETRYRPTNSILIAIFNFYFKWDMPIAIHNLHLYKKNFDNPSFMWN